MQRRQDATSKFDLSYSGTQGNTATTIKSTAKSSENNSGSGSITATGSSSQATGKETGKGSSGNQTHSSYETTKTFDARKPAGGVQMITPAALAASQYYKIADYVTFAWNYTSLSITPSAVDILASCSENSATYTIAVNQSITGQTQAVTWDTGNYQSTASTPLLVATYTLIIYDADSSVSATAQAGYLGVYDQFTFGMYTPQPYTPISDYVCATCNAAMSSMERQTLGFMFGMVIVTILSFSWFAGVAGWY